VRLAVVGGKLQGVEAAYLGLKAGYEVVLIDRLAGVPATGLAAETHVLDVVHEPERARRLFRTCDAVLPACEDNDTLSWLVEQASTWGVPLLFDLSAQVVSSSKLRSNRLFDELGIPRPSPWPACGFPLIVKPSGTSGSEGVRLVDNADELAAAREALEAAGHETVIEEFAPGPSLSLEVVAWQGEVAPLLGTELEFDRYYDCKRVLAPVTLAAAPDLLARLDDIGARLARGLDLNGVMDIEVMVHAGELKVLEIDARLPSQTPTVVYGACGVNIVALLVETVLGGALPRYDRTVRGGCCYQHVCIAGGAVEVLGEHMMGGARPLRLVAGLYGADEVITDLPAGADGLDEEWVATIITFGADARDARARADAAVLLLAAEHGLAVTPETSAQPGDECR